jgi:hypothetical protein
MSVLHQIPASPSHVKVTGPAPAFGYERCEDAGCSVAADGVASSCGRTACPSCGYGGTNLVAMRLVDSGEVRYRCACGHAWVHGATA